jgi:hypothetical protein
MKNALERLDDLIDCTFNSNPVNGVNLSEGLANDRIRQAMAEKDNILKELMHPSLIFRTTQEWELHINHYQCVITYLADRVSALREQNTETIPGKFYTDLMRILFDLLNFIQQRFSFYLNREEKMPLALQRVKRRLLQDLLKQFTTVFNNEINDLPLYSAVTKPITSFLQAEVHELFSYSKTDYLFHYISALKHLPSKTKSPVMELISILVRMNCNSEALKKYIIDKMKAEVQKCDSDKLMGGILNNWKDFFTELPVRLNAIFNKNSVSLKEEMLRWIEIKLPKQVSGQDCKSTKRNQSIDKTGETGLFYMLTVEEYALLKRVEKDSGVISNRNTAEMMRQIAPLLHTVKQYDVSWQNLYNSFYNIEKTTVKSLSDKIFVITRALHQLELTLKRKNLGGKK